MAEPVLNDQVWKRIAPLLPVPRARRSQYPGRKPLDDRRVLNGILYVLKTGIGWEELPRELHCGSGMTCWRRLQDWKMAGIWPPLQEALLAVLPGADQFAWWRTTLCKPPREKAAAPLIQPRTAGRTPSVPGPS